MGEEEQKETNFCNQSKFQTKELQTNQVNDILNVKDCFGKKAIFYALLQKSGKMTSCLNEIGAMSENVRNEANKAFDDRMKKIKDDKLKSLEKLYGASLLNKRVDTILDARKWRSEYFIEEDEMNQSAEQIGVDGPAKNELGKKAKVLTDDCGDGSVYNWDGLYVNVDKGRYGAYMFYKLQLLYEPIQKLTILWTRWGRPGETGKYQRSPYQNKQDAIKEFRKIFKAKTMNEWENRSRDKFEPKKWRIVRKKRRRKKKKMNDKTPHNLINSIKEILRSLPKEQRPKTMLSSNICNFIYSLFDIAALTQSRRRLGLNADIERLGYLEDADLDKSYAIIQKISDLVQAQDEESEKIQSVRIKKSKIEKQVRMRDSKRERNKNLYLKNEQKLQQQVSRICVEMKAIKTKMTNIEKEIKRLEEGQNDKPLTDDCAQKQSLAMIQNEFMEKEKNKKQKEEEMKQQKIVEMKRMNDENTEFDPFDNLDNAKIKEFEIELIALNESSALRRKRISHLSNEYYLIMPQTEFANSYITAIDNMCLVNKHMKIMMNLSEHQIAISALMAAQFQLKYNNVHPVDYCYLSLKCKMLPLMTECYEFNLILSYMNRTASPMIKKENVTIYELWKEDEDNAYSKYLSFENRMLLWHGSDASNICGILTNGLKVAPPEADATGYMFGKGIYFADAFQKSMCYASTGNQRNLSNAKCLFLCQVALGKMYECVTAEYLKSAKSGFDSTKGLGQKGPNPSHVKTSCNGEIIPDSPTIAYPQRTKRDKENKIVPIPFCLNWNEYIVYSENQAKLKYLIVIKQ